MESDAGTVLGEKEEEGWKKKGDGGRERERGIIQDTASEAQLLCVVGNLTTLATCYIPIAKKRRMFMCVFVGVGGGEK